MTVLTSRSSEGPKRKFAGKYSRYPDETGKRQAEGGRRLRGEDRDSRPGAPLVTILTVCFNSAKTIAQTIRSVQEQTYGNIEYVVVDGASTDGTVDILRAREELIDYYVSEPDEGLYYAMNKGIELARGDYILILNADDWFERDAVEALVAAHDYSGCDFTAALARYIDEENGRETVLRSMPFDDSVYFRMPLRHETMLIPAWLFDRVGPYDTDFRITADRDLTARLFESGATFYELPRALLNFRTTGVSNTDTERLGQEKDRLLQKEFPFLSAQERERLNDPRSADAETFAEIANVHLDQPKFVKAVRAVLADRRANNGKRWQGGALETIGVRDPATWPQVSVILPFYEAAGTLTRALDSVCAQSLKSFEVICVNDCAIDDSQRIVDEYAARDRRIRSIRNSRNLGLGASRNAGIRAARGRYIFHLDPDDTIPPHALARLHETAVAHGSKMVKGAYEAGQGLHQEKSTHVTVKYPCGARKVVANTDLARTPRLLHTTEGHWSYLYDAIFARSVPYPTDLKMGQDSIFLVNAVARARKITLLPEIVYHYEANPNSAMNRFTARKYFDALEWRRRAWHVLRDATHRRAGDRLLFTYWSPAFFEALEARLLEEERDRFLDRLGHVLRATGYPGSMLPEEPVLRARLDAAFDRVGAAGTSGASAGRALKIATLSTQDHGGAGIGSQRRVEALRRHGVNAHIYCIFRNTDKPHVHQVPLRVPGAETDLRGVWRRAAVLTRTEHPGLKAREMFSKAGSIVDFRDIASVVQDSDIVHMHWISGMFDYARADVLNDRPVVWTLADMNAFTGGCHYSEGCKGYLDECRDCPLLEDGSTLAHEIWKAKRDAYEKIEVLHIICPSQWLADCAKESALLKDRPVHMIPNALPVDRFKPTNRMVARRKLGLPLTAKLVAFGADSLDNRRKGGDILAEAMQILSGRGQTAGMEGLFFGANSLDLGIKAHNMGHVSDEEKLSLIYSAADVFAFPSREDNAPLTFVEALLSGTQVVAFPVGNVPELVTHKDTGYIAKFADAEDFANGLIWALSDRHRPETTLRSLRGHIRARRHNDPDIAVERHLALYRTLVPGDAA